MNAPSACTSLKEVKMNDKTTEAMKALRANSIAYGRNNEGIVHPIITNEFDYIWQVREIERLEIKLAQSTGNLFSVKTVKPFNRTYINPTKLGEMFIACLNFDLNEIRKHFPNHQFNPHLDLFERHVLARNLKEIVWLITPPVNEDVVKWCDVLIGCAKSIQDEANKTRFKKVVNAFHHAANKNYRELRHYFVNLVDAYADIPLEVSRYDFGFQKDQFWPVVETVVQYSDAKKHWGIFMRAINKELPPDCLAGYAWRLTSSRDNSFNFHFVAFTDKSKMPDGINIERIFFDQWQRITDDKGLAFNCKYFGAGFNHAFNEEYKSCGIGLINNSAIREELEQVAFYMTQPDYHIRFVAPGKGRTFGKGVLPK